MKYSYHSFKRIIDIGGATVGLLLLWPLLLLLVTANRLVIGSPILFRQQRPGLSGKPFLMLKFRTMTDQRDTDGRILPDEVRLTRFGRFLRGTSLDELPEIFNVLRGEMSLVGPRPLLTKYIERYSSEQARRMEVKPGITGWAQVNGRNAIGWEKRFQLDVWYVDHCGFWLDMKILWMTLSAVLSRRGISAEGHSTMLEFEGTQDVETSRVFVVGAGGHGKVVVSTLQAAGLTVEAVYDDNPGRWVSTILGVPVRGPLRELAAMPDVRAVLGVGDNEARQRLAEQLPLRWITVVHPNAVVHPSAELGCGTVVCAGAVVQPDVSVGQHTIVNTSASVDHDCRLGNFVSVGPGARLAGGVGVGDRTALGIASCVIPGVQIESDVVVGAGTVVIRNVARNCTIVGNPSRVIRQSSHDDRKAA